jgi:hypothetical protein
MLTPAKTHHQKIEAQLSQGEQVLWSGQPRQGIIFRGADALMIPFSLMWGGFAIFWELSVLLSGAPMFFALWGIPFVIIGLYLIFGRFFFEAKQRANTFYAVTNERILIIAGIFSQKVKSMNLRTLSDLSLSEGSGDVGTITFGGGSLYSALNGFFPRWPGMGSQVEPCFELIFGAKSVYDIIRAAQRAS